MGDMADWHIEQGIDELAAHSVGDCEYGCPYCAEEERKAKEARRRKAKKRKSDA